MATGQDQVPQAFNSTLYFEMLVKLGFVHGPRKLTPQGQRQLLDAWAGLERTFQDLPEWEPEEPQQQRVIPVGVIPGGRAPEAN